MATLIRHRPTGNRKLVLAVRRTPVPIMASLALLLLVLVAAVSAPWVAPHDPLQQDLIHRSLQPPAFAGGDWAYPLGTDGLGRDLLSRIIYGARISLLVGGIATAISAVLGVTIGVVAGFFGGWIDAVFMRIADMQQAFPFILLAIAVMAVWGPGLVNLMLVLGVTGWVIFARVVRSVVLVLKGQEFVQAARALGLSSTRIMVRHILPNVASTVLVLASFAFVQFILAEAALSFLGLGVPPPTPTWGGILAEGRVYMIVAWWITALPGIAILVTVLAVNLVGDWLRDLLDPRLRNWS